MEMKNIAGLYLNLQVQTKTKDKASHYNPRLFGPHIYEEVEQRSFLIRKGVHWMKTSSGE